MSDTSSNGLSASGGLSADPWFAAGFTDIRDSVLAGHSVTLTGSGGEKVVIDSIDELQDLIDRWKELTTQMQTGGLRLDAAITGAVAPADDVVSKAFNNAVASSLEAARQHNNDTMNKSEAFTTNLGTAHKTYVTVEMAADHSMRKWHRTLGGQA